MKRGDQARANVYEIIQNAFGENFINVVDKKIYVLSEENGEKIQFAISITMPKTPVNKKDSNELNFSSNESSTVFSASSTKTAITSEEEDAVRKLMEELGL